MGEIEESEFLEKVDLFHAEVLQTDSLFKRLLAYFVAPIAIGAVLLGVSGYLLYENAHRNQRQLVKLQKLRFSAEDLLRKSSGVSLKAKKFACY